MSSFSIVVMYYLIPLLVILTAAFIIIAVRYTLQVSDTSTINHNKTMYFDTLQGRKKEIRRLVGQILTGQSSVIVSMLSQDRANILGYLSDTTHSKQLYGEHAEKLIFSWLDMHSLFLKYPDCQSEQFWQAAFTPLIMNDHIPTDAVINKTYQACVDKHFSESTLEKLIAQMKQDGWQLVLILDRFDELLESPLDDPEFFATLRRLASFRSPSPLTLIISGEVSLQLFHEKTKSLGPKGSPYLNFIESGQIVLGSLTDIEVDELLAEMPFSKKERQFILSIAGKHPHFLQIAASTLQMAKDAQEKQPLNVAKQDFYARVENMLKNIIQAWDTEVCQAIVALVKHNRQLDFFDINDKIFFIEKQGFLFKNNQNQWQVSPQVLVDFINSKAEHELCNH